MLKYFGLHCYGEDYSYLVKVTLGKSGKQAFGYVAQFQGWATSDLILDRRD